MKNKRVIIISLVVLACVMVAGGFIFFYEEQHEIAPPLEVNAELAGMVEMELTQSERGRSNENASVTAIIRNNTENEVFLQGEFTVEFFDGTNWRVIPTKIPDFEAGRSISHMMPEVIGSVFPVPRRATTTTLFRLRQRISFSSDQMTGTNHDLVLEFNLN